MINMNCNPHALSFGRLGRPTRNSLPSNLSRSQQSAVEHIEETISKVAQNSQQISAGISKKEVSELLEAQNQAIGKALIALLDAINGKDVDAYSVIVKTLFK